GREKILDVTRESLEALGYWPIPADEAEPAPEPAIAVAAPVAPSPALDVAPEMTIAAISLPDAAEIDRFVANIDAGKSGMDYTETVEIPAPVEPEMRSVVEIAPGR